MFCRCAASWRTGNPCSLDRKALDAPGLDLLALVIGSEGMLAVTTEVVVKLIPKPQLAPLHHGEL